MSTLIAVDPVQTNGTHAAVHPEFAGTTANRIDDSTFLQQIDRILQSSELGGSEVLRRLLRYLAEKTITGEADELKEYTVAIDGLGKPASYDPRHTSAVRILAGRLRQKLIDYYRSEGQDDTVIVSLPKGHFRLSYRCRAVATEIAPESYEAPHPTAEAEEVPVPAPVPARTRVWPRFGPVMLIALISIALNIYFWVQHSWNARERDASGAVELTPAMKDLWSPFINSNRPLMLVLEDPLFVEFHSGNGVYYRDKSNGNTWDAVVNTPALKKLRDALNNPGMGPSHYYTAFGEAHAAFAIGRLFGTRNQNFFTLARASEVSPAQIASNNILSVGIPTAMFQDELQEMPIQTQLQFVLAGIQNLHPGAGEPTLYSDRFSTSPTEEGVAYALVSHLPGPQRNTDVESFVGNRSAAYVAAVEALANPEFARNVVAKLRAQAGGQLPRYFQLVLKVNFKNSVPTETTCVLVKELH